MWVGFVDLRETRTFREKNSNVKIIESFFLELFKFSREKPTLSFLEGRTVVPNFLGAEQYLYFQN